MADVLFHGGPCDGQHASYDPDQAGTGTLSCKGVSYHLYALTSGNFLALLPGAAPPNPGAILAPVSGEAIQDANVAWRNFNRAFGQGLPTQVNRTATLRRQLRRLGAR